MMKNASGQFWQIRRCFWTSKTSKNQKTKMASKPKIRKTTTTQKTIKYKKIEERLILFVWTIFSFSLLHWSTDCGASRRPKAQTDGQTDSMLLKNTWGCPILPLLTPDVGKRGQNAGNHRAYRGKPDVRLEFCRISYVSSWFPIFSYIFVYFPRFPY